MERIKIGYPDLLRQSQSTAHDYLLSARNDIDKVFGEGFAAKNPGLVSTYMQVAMRDFTVAALLKAGLEVAEEVLSAIPRPPSE